jgi:hypothetical protein
MQLAPALRGHITMAYYQAGHMMYTRMSELQKLKQDIAKFTASCLP